MKHILLVEDDPFIRDMYSTKLKEIGFFVETAKTGKEAIEKVNKEKPDLILLDIVLPHKDGWRVLKEIKQKQKFKNVQIIMLTNLGQKMEVEKGLKLGAEKYLIKAHYTPQQVAEEVEKLLK